MYPWCVVREGIGLIELALGKGEGTQEEDPQQGTPESAEAVTNEPAEALAA